MPQVPARANPYGCDDDAENPGTVHIGRRFAGDPSAATQAVARHEGFPVDAARRRR